MFGSPAEGITLPMLRERLAAMNIVTAESDLLAMFARYDKDSNGAVSFSELANALFNKPADGALWSHASDLAVRPSSCPWWG